MEKYTIYLGLNDKDTKQQKISTIEAYKLVENIIHHDCTIYEGKGYYTHENGEKVVETTLIIHLLFVSEKEVVDICKMLKVAFNQECVAYDCTIINSKLV